jgi:hypothetical protein
MLPGTGSDKSPEELFSTSPVRPTTRFLHPFGCPVYVLCDDLQGGKSIPRWDERSRVGVYVGHSAQHSPTVSLILNPQTGYISPQFHCVFDDNFDTPSQDANFSSVWEEKAGFRDSTAIPPERGEANHGQKEYLHKEIPENLKYPFTVEEAAANKEDNNPTTIKETEGASTEPTENVPATTTDTNVEEMELPAQSTATTTRSGRTVKRSSRLQDSD